MSTGLTPITAISEVPHLQKQMVPAEEVTSAASVPVMSAEPVKRKTSHSSVASSMKKEEVYAEAEAQLIAEQKEVEASASAGLGGFFANLKYETFHPYVLAALAALVLGWWISSTILPATRGRW